MRTIHSVTRSFLLAIGCCCAAPPLLAQRGRADLPEPYTLADVLSAPFASSLVAAPSGRAVAWLGYEEGRRNVWVAEAPLWRARRLTRYAEDDGQQLSELTWTPDSRALLYVRGGAPGSNWSEDVPANPTSDPRGAEQAVWLVTLAGGRTRRVAEGHAPRPSPTGGRVAFVLRDTIRVAALSAAGPPGIPFRARGASDEPEWSPDGRQLAFVSRRSDHSFIGVYDLARRTLRWLAPGTWRDDLPRWSPDGSRIAFVRRPGLPYATGLQLPPPRAASGLAAFTIQVADAATGELRDVWRSPATPDGAFPGLAEDWALQWGAGDRLVFASELTGWLGLYAVSSTGSEAVRLTPSGCEVQDVRMSADRQELVYASNCGDVDRRHVQRVSLSGGEPLAVTSGSGIEWSPAPLAEGAVMVLRSDVRRPASPALAGSDGLPALDGWPLPVGFPIGQLVEPVSVVVTAPDSAPIHVQLFLPPDGGTSRRPAVMFFHGGPSRQMLLGWNPRGYYHNAYAMNQYLASRGFVVVSVNYRGGVGYGRAFREAPNRGRFGASEYQDVVAAAAWLRGRPDVDSARIGLWGGSYGGYLTALGLARNSDLFAAGFDLHGVHDYADEIGATRQFGVSDSTIASFRRSSPVGDLARWRSPVLLVAGDDDRNVQFQQTVDLALRLRRLGVRVEELVFPDDVHSFLRHANWLAAYRAGAGFFAQTLGSEGR